MPAGQPIGQTVMKPASPPLSPQPAICQPAGSPGYLLTRQPIRARAPLVIPSCLCSPRVFLAFSLGFPRAHVPVALMFPSCRLPAVCQPYSTPFGRQRVGQCGGNLISPRGQPESQPVSLIVSLLDMQVASQPICQPRRDHDIYRIGVEKLILASRENT